jgi:hypothetical protein
MVGLADRPPHPKFAERISTSPRKRGEVNQMFASIQFKAIMLWAFSPPARTCRATAAAHRLGIGGLVVAVLQHLQFLQRDEAAIHHPIENGQEFVDLGFGIHDFDHQGQIE